jgi:hypothetical protein
LFPPFLANIFALVVTLDSTYAFPFVGAVAAEVIIANAVVDVREWDVDGLMALVLAVEAGQS